MRIGIVTFHWADNYGAVLQAYALQRYLIGEGHEVDVVDYRPSWAKDANKIPRPKNPKDYIRYIDQKIKRSRFDRFRNKCLKINRDLHSDYDILITGSDQVFNPDIICKDGKLDTRYLLDWPNECVKVSYAASFGNSTLDVKYEDIFKNQLSGFRLLSVREESGVVILSNLGLQNSTIVPDPTFLIKDFPYLINNSPRKNKNYIFEFMFHRTNQSDITVNRISRILGVNKTKRIINFRQFCHGSKGLLSPTVSGWISIIRNSSFVVTDSFHCTVFCILQHVPFLVISLDAWGKDWSERIRSLLKSLNLTERLVCGATIDSIDLEALALSEIDWKSVDDKVDVLRQSGHRFLEKL